MKYQIIRTIILIAFILLILFTIRWKWNECRQVGHGVMYCVLNQGK